MGRLRRRRSTAGLPEAGELCAVEALDREGLLVTREGALVRYLRVSAKNPLVMSHAEREHVGHSLGQWAQITAAGALAAAFGVYVSPFPVSVTIFVSIVAAGMPVALSYGAMGLEFAIGAFAAAAWRYWRAPRRYLAGAGGPSRGYVVEREPLTVAPDRREAPLAEREPLWDV